MDDAELNQRIAERVHQLRAERGFSLEELATRSGVSRSTISLIERAETSPTAVVLGRLASGLGMSLPALFEASAAEPARQRGPLARRTEQAEWRDPTSGYVRRNVSPTSQQRIQLVEVLFPAGARVAFENGARDVLLTQQVWLLEGELTISVGSERFRLHQGDCLAMTLDRPTMFHNPKRKLARYAVVVSSEPRLRRS